MKDRRKCLADASQSPRGGRTAARHWGSWRIPVLLAVVFFCTATVMSGYEFLKEYWAPQLTKWESHIVTIAVSSIVATVLSRFVIRRMRGAEAKYRNLFDSSCDALMTLEPPSWKFTYGNPAMLEMFRLKNVRELTVLGPWDISPDRQPDGCDSAEKVKEMIETAMREGSRLFEWTHKRIDGEEFPATVLLTRMEQAGKVFVLATVRDTAVQKHVEEERKKQLVQRQGVNELQRSLLESAALEEKLKKVTDGIVRLFDADFCRIWLIRPGDLCQRECIHAAVKEGLHVCRYRDRCLHLLASSGRYTHLDGPTHRRVPYDCYKIGRVASGKDHKFLTNDAPNDPRVHNHQWARDLGLVSFAGYQLRVPGGKTLGVLGLFAKHPIDESEDAMLDGLSSAVALVVEQAAVQEALRQSESRFDQLAEQSRTIIWETDAEGLYTYVSHVAEVVLGYRREEIVGRRHFYDLHPEGGREAFKTAALGVFDRRERFVNLENAAVTKDGRVVWFITNGIPQLDADGTLRGYCGSGTDITVQKHGEEALRTGERRLRLFADNVSDVIWNIDLSGHITYLSPSAEQMVGLKWEEGMQVTIAEVVAPSALPVAQEALQNIAAAAQRGERIKISKDIELLRRDGSTLWSEIVASASFDDSGQLVGFSGVTRDITARKRAEQELREANARLEQAVAQAGELAVQAQAANRAKSEFLTNMSHEIRTPMTAILGYADLMLEENIGRAAREHVAVVKRNGEHLLQVINDILDLSKIEAEKLQIEPTCCSPIQMAAEVVSLLRPQAAAKHLYLKTELTAPLPETVLTDPLRLRQVLVNLVGNGIKFTDQGEVCLAVRLNADCDRVSLCFDVSDTGIGMSEEQIGKLFKPFSQADNSSARKFGGTGLGLCISKRLAEALGGGIEVRSEPGRGSTFSVTIDPGPLEGTHMIRNAQETLLGRPPSTTAAPPVKIALHGRILLAEDGMDNQRLIALLLQKAGADVTTVVNGQQAVEAALAAREAGEPFGVIFMDMQMPVMDGYEATAQLRKRGYTGSIVALTADAMATDYQKCLNAGCNDYLPKPFQQHTLLEIASRYIAAEKPDQFVHSC